MKPIAVVNSALVEIGSAIALDAAGYLVVLTSAGSAPPVAVYPPPVSQRADIAKHILAGMCACPIGADTVEEMALDALRAADALIAELAKEKL